MVDRRQASKTDATTQDEMMKRGKKKDDWMRALKKDDTMMAGKEDKRFEEFRKISWGGRRLDVLMFHSSSANFDPEKGSISVLLLFIHCWDLLVNCSV